MTTGTPPAAPNVRITRQTWVRLARALRGLLQSEVGGRATALFVTLLALLLVVNGMNVVNSYVGRDFMTSIERRDGAGFFRYALAYVAVFGASTLFAVLARFAEARLDLVWRRWLTRFLVYNYLDDRIYFRLGVSGAVTNPDQRIAEDVRSFSSTAVSFVVLLSNGALTAIGFSGVLWTISPLLFGVAIAYAAAGSVVTWLLARPLVDLTYLQSDREADLRSDLIHVRENYDSIALLRREERLRTRMMRRLEALVANTRRVIAVNRNVGFFTNAYGYAIQLIPVLIVAPLYFREEVPFGVITQSAMAFSALVGAISIIINQFQSISNFAAVLGRLQGLSEAVEQIRKEPLSHVEVKEDSERLAYQGLDLAAADGTPLVKELSIEIPRGAELVLVIGNTLARGALLRATAGLWPGARGVVVRPPLEKVFFVTERPYLPPGTLREVLISDWDQQTVPDADIARALGALGIESVAERSGGYDTEQNWTDLLSLGEQQLFVVARVLLAMPHFALLDRPTSALDDAQRALVLRVLAEHSISTLVFEEADPCLECEGVLQLSDDGSWTYQPRVATG